MFVFVGTVYRNVSHRICRCAVFIISASIQNFTRITFVVRSFVKQHFAWLLFFCSAKRYPNKTCIILEDLFTIHNLSCVSVTPTSEILTVAMFILLRAGDYKDGVASNGMMLISNLLKIY